MAQQFPPATAFPTAAYPMPPEKLGEMAEALRKALDSGMISGSDATNIMRSAAAPYVGVSVERDLAHNAVIARAARQLTSSASSDHPMGPSEWMLKNIEALDALKDVMEFLAAQENLDLWVHKPLQKAIFTAIIRAGINEALGVR